MHAEREEPKLSEAEDLWDYTRIPGHRTYLAWRVDVSLYGLYRVQKACHIQYTYQTSNEGEEKQVNKSLNTRGRCCK
jgi:hypothetical protein